MHRSDLSPEEKDLAFEWVDELQFAQSLADVQAVSERPFSLLFGAEYSAICLSLKGDAAHYEWETRLSVPLLADYAQWAHKDFVLNAVTRRPNVALSDTDMLLAEKLENTFTYRLSRDLGMRLKHVLSVGIVRSGEHWHGGVTLYSERRRFSPKHRDMLDWARRRIENAFWNIRRFGDSERGRLLEVISGQEGAFLVLTPHGEEKARTLQATVLLERWFQSERGGARVPALLKERLALLVKNQENAAAGLFTLELVGPDATLLVKFNPLPLVENRCHWEISLKELPHPLPGSWRERLTAKQVEIANLLLQGGQNEDIAEAAGCTVGTVKVHLRRIYKAVGADSRADFISRALLRR